MTYHTVTFIASGTLSLVDPSDAIRIVQDGNEVGSLPQVYPSAYCSGWYTGQNGTGTQVTSSTVITSDMTFYAKYSGVSG